MTATTNTRCIVELPFDMRFTIRVHTFEDHLKKATKHLQEPDQEWELQAQRVVQRWLYQEILPQLQGELNGIAPFSGVESHAAWVMHEGAGVGRCTYGCSHVNEVTYVADEAGLVDE